MKTLIIWSEFLGLPEFALVDGDWSHLNGFIINETQDDKKQDELNALVFDKKWYKKTIFGRFIPDSFDVKSHKQINVGFAP